MVLFYNSFLKSCGSLRQLFSCIGVKSCVSIGNILRQKYQRHVTVTSVLALATLGYTTQIEMTPKVTKISTVTCLSRQLHVAVVMVSLTNVANVNDL